MARQGTCARCGAKVAVDAARCVKCGLPQSAVVAAPVSRATGSQRRQPARPARPAKAKVRRQKRAFRWGRLSRRAKLIGAVVVVVMLLLGALAGSAGTTSRPTNTPEIVTAP